MHSISRREWLAQAGALSLAGDPLLGLSAAAGPLQSGNRTYRVSVKSPSPLRTNHANLVLLEPQGDLTDCMSDPGSEEERRSRFIWTAFGRTCGYSAFRSAVRTFDGNLVYWFYASLQRGDVVICYDDSDICRLAAVTGGYSFNANGPEAHIQPLAWFPATIPRRTMESAFMSQYPTRGCEDVSDPRRWLDTDALSAVETVIGARLQCPAVRDPWTVARCDLKRLQLELDLSKSEA